jgi:glutathione peroxidase-family protein
MIKNIYLLIVAVCVQLTVSAQSVFDISVNHNEGGAIPLSRVAGKKILIIILPLKQEDQVFQQLKEFKKRYADSITVIGIPVFEEGYEANKAVAFRQLYAGMGITLTEGMKARKNSGTAQHALFQWLTDVGKNRYSTVEQPRIGHKFFINESGRLYAVMRQETSLQSPIIDRIVHSGNQ